MGSSDSKAAQKPLNYNSPGMPGYGQPYPPAGPQPGMMPPPSMNPQYPPNPMMQGPPPLGVMNNPYQRMGPPPPRMPVPPPMPPPMNVNMPPGPAYPPQRLDMGMNPNMISPAPNTRDDMILVNKREFNELKRMLTPVPMSRSMFDEFPTAMQSNTLAAPVVTSLQPSTIVTGVPNVVTQSPMINMNTIPQIQYASTSPALNQIVGNDYLSTPQLVQSIPHINQSSLVQPNYVRASQIIPAVSASLPSSYQSQIIGNISSNQPIITQGNVSYSIPQETLEGTYLQAYPSNTQYINATSQPISNINYGSIPLSSNVIYQDNVPYINSNVSSVSQPLYNGAQIISANQNYGNVGAYTTNVGLYDATIAEYRS